MKKFSKNNYSGKNKKHKENFDSEFYPRNNNSKKNNSKFMNNSDKTYEQTKEYYGKILQKSTDLKTNACCTSIKYPKHILNAMKNPRDLNQNLVFLLLRYDCKLTHRL